MCCLSLINSELNSPLILPLTIIHCESLVTFCKQVQIFGTKIRSNISNNVQTTAETKQRKECGKVSALFALFFEALLTFCAYTDEAESEFIQRIHLRKYGATINSIDKVTGKHSLMHLCTESHNPNSSALLEQFPAFQFSMVSNKTT